jgi:hypothetical protein
MWVQENEVSSWHGEEILSNRSGVRWMGYGWDRIRYSAKASAGRRLLRTEGREDDTETGLKNREPETEKKRIPGE